MAIRSFIRSFSAKHASMWRHTVLALCMITAPLTSADWLEWRGPHQNGVSDETGLPDTWEPGGKNQLWSIELADPLSLDNHIPQHIPDCHRLRAADLFSTCVYEPDAQQA